MQENSPEFPAGYAYDSLGTIRRGNEECMLNQITALFMTNAPDILIFWWLRYSYITFMYL